MAKKRKTRSEKVRAHERREKTEGFVIKEEWLNKDKKDIQQKIVNPDEKKYFKADLTKTLILTMLVLALELAIWLYLSRR